eukprot:1875693-Rhodomonas_salina.1
MSSQSPNCSNCGLGQFQDQSGQSGCKDCIEGEYGPAQEAARCFSCESGTYTDQPKQSSCLDCSILFPNGLRECQFCSTSGIEQILP